ncbi:O-methyltransferase [Cohnella lupini]|uniref:Putative O-methyltransferase YrrM n=1 Tax=Cohnella lupini TaxID=1294267 RepID=A0A3D9IVM5_9BACL|nr:class I SAM-dependent methyltransferase [Cohnella lupini]RED65569.1 putative O-methyltransferase YrrM [Cohnella lupini]
MTILPEQYFDDLYRRDSDLERVVESIRRAGMPEISVAAGYGRLLTFLVAITGARSILEIGALGGYSGICLARGLPEDGRLISLELKQEYADIAKDNMTAAGHGSKAEYLVGDASESLDKLALKDNRFDFFFIDADKENYPNYLEACIALANEGAIIAADNTLLRGKTIDDNKQGPSVLAIRQFNRLIAQDSRLMGVHLPAFDGLALAKINLNK